MGRGAGERPNSKFVQWLSPVASQKRGTLGILIDLCFVQLPDLSNNLEVFLESGFLKLLP